MRRRFEATTYTDTGEERTYPSVSQDPATGVITGITTTSPCRDLHHTATWTPISAEEKAAFQQAAAARRQRTWKIAAPAGITQRPEG